MWWSSDGVGVGSEGLEERGFLNAKWTSLDGRIAVSEGVSWGKAKGSNRAAQPLNAPGLDLIKFSRIIIQD